MAYNNLTREASEPYKAQYDGLIDDYSSPYTTNAGHQTHTIKTPPLDTHHYRRPSIGLGSKSGKLSDDTHDDQSHPIYPPTAPRIKDHDSRSLWQKIMPESMACRLYVITVLIETAIDLAIESELLVRVNEAAGDKTFSEFSQTDLKMPVYLGIFAVAHVFQFVMAVDAVYARNTLQFLALTLFNALFLAYSIIQITEVRAKVSEFSTTGITDVPIKVLTTTIPIVISIAEVAYIALGWKIYNEFGWKVYKFLGADRRIKRMYASYQIYECLIKFDVFFWAAFSIQFIGLVLRKNEAEFYVTCAALPISLILLVEGHLAARHENKWMMATFMSGCVGAMVYFVYKLVKVLLYIHSDLFKDVYKSLITFSVLAILLLIVTFVLSVMVLKNFGRGLKDALSRKDASQHQRYASQGPHRTVSTLNPNRMSID